MNLRHDNELTSVRSLDLPRYLGTWYEIARLPNRHEDEAITDVTADYSLHDGKIRVENRCVNAKGEQEVTVGEAVASDESNARLAVSFLPDGLRWIPFTKGDYWVMRVDPEYRVALVGEPDRKYLWLLARQPTMPDEIKHEWLEYASGQGYELSKLITTLHTRGAGGAAR